VWVKSREDAVRALRTGQATLNVAAVIEAAAPEIFPGDEFRQAGLRQAWNILSSDAHVLVWSLAMRTTFATPADKLTGLSTGTADGLLKWRLPAVTNEPKNASPFLRAEWKNMRCSDREAQGLVVERLDEREPGTDRVHVVDAVTGVEVLAGRDLHPGAHVVEPSADVLGKLVFGGAP